MLPILEIYPDFCLQTIIRNWFINQRFWRNFTLCWAILIAVLSFIPGNRLPEINWDLISIDTVAHFALYMVLVFSAFVGLGKNNLNLSDSQMYIIMTSGGMVYGLMIELIQGFLIYQRFFDLKDILANGVGTIFGAILFRLMRIK